MDVVDRKPYHTVDLSPDTGLNSANDDVDTALSSCDNEIENEIDMSSVNDCLQEADAWGKFKIFSYIGVPDKNDFPLVAGAVIRTSRVSNCD